jgi:hypothetical protein
MKKILFLITLTCLILVPFQAGAVSLDELSSDAVIVSIEDYAITVTDFTWYLAGFSSFQQLSAEQADYILDLMVIDILFALAAEEAGIQVADEEVTAYRDYFFSKLSLDINDPKSYETYFYMNDPYYNMEDFYAKSGMKLLRVKYLASRGYIDSVTVRHCFLSTKGLSAAEKREKKRVAIQLANNIMSGNILFEDAVAEYGDEFPDSKSLDSLGIIRADKRARSIFKNSDLKRILNSGIFSILFVEGKKGFHIIMNTDYTLPETDLLLRIVAELKERYTITRKINFGDKTPE